jgi:hypothetical protein
MYLKDLLILGNSSDPQNQFDVILNLYYVTACTPHLLLPSHSVEPYLINRLSTLYCRFHNKILRILPGAGKL